MGGSNTSASYSSITPTFTDTPALDLSGSMSMLSNLISMNRDMTTAQNQNELFQLEKTLKTQQILSQLDEEEYNATKKEILDNQLEAIKQSNADNKDWLKSLENSKWLKQLTYLMKIIGAVNKLKD